MPEPAAPPAPAVPPTPPRAPRRPPRPGDWLRQIAGPAAATAVSTGARLGDGGPVPVSAGRGAAADGGAHSPEAAGWDADSTATSRGSWRRAGPPSASAWPRCTRGCRGAGAACDAHGLPLLEVPPRTTFTAVARAVWQLMARARHRGAAPGDRGPAVAGGGRGPARPGPAVLRQLAQRVGGRAVLYPGRTRTGAGRTAPTAGGVGLPGAAGPRRTTAPTARRPAPAPATPSPTPRLRHGHRRRRPPRRPHPASPGHGFTLAVAPPRGTRATRPSPPSPPSCYPPHRRTAERHRSGAASALARLLLGAPPDALAPPRRGPPVARGARPRGGARPRSRHPRRRPRSERPGLPSVRRPRAPRTPPLPADATRPPGPGWTLGVRAHRAAGVAAADAQAARALPGPGRPRAPGPARPARPSPAS